MKKLIWLIIGFAYIGAAALSVQQSIESHRKSELRELRYKVALKVLYKKYKWKSDRLRIYTDLVYNVNGRAVYEKKK
jgi:hypothetical protein